MDRIFVSPFAAAATLATLIWGLTAPASATPVRPHAGNQVPNAAHESVLYSFTGMPDGAFTTDGLLVDASGALYGETDEGGTGTCVQFKQVVGCGLVFKLTPSGSGYTESVLYDFRGGTDGALPIGGLIEDGSGALYGTTQSGGTQGCKTIENQKGCGTVFELQPSGSGYKEIILRRFQTGVDGRYPANGVIEDASGAFYGTTAAGGTAGNGTAFKLTPSGTAYKETILHDFLGGADDGASPAGALLADADGALYGVANSGGAGLCGEFGASCGVVFKLTPSGNGYAETVLWNFPGGPDGGYPTGALIADSQGALYGTTSARFANNGNGNVYKLAPSPSGYSETPIYNFKGTKNGYRDGAFPAAGVIADRSGNLYGTTEGGGTLGNECRSNGCGTVFELVRSGRTYKESILCRFQGGSDASTPFDGLAVDSSGNLFGTTERGGASDFGAVFEITNVQPKR